MELGEKYRVTPAFSVAKNCERPRSMVGKVTYIHPRGRFVVLEFDGGSRECFPPEQLTESNRVRDKQNRREING